jgi:hypothetical protein
MTSLPLDPKSKSLPAISGDGPRDTGAYTHSFVTTRDEPFVCFVAGTKILTDQGEKPVEELAPGTLVVTGDHGLQPVRWIGRRTVSGLDAMAPITFSKGAIGNSETLQVSPRHRMLVGGWRAEMMFGTSEILVPALHLVNGDTIFQAPVEAVEYLHVMFDRHEIIIANGSPSESFHPTERCLSIFEQQTRDEILSIFPELEWCVESYGETARLCIDGHEARALLG